MQWTFERLSAGQWQPSLVGAYFVNRDLTGVSANKGLLRFHDNQSGPIAQQFVDSAFGGRGVRADVFAYDWRARQFAISTCFDADGNYVGGGQPGMIVALDPFDMVTEPWGLTIDKFENALAMSVVGESLRPDLFEQWRTANGIDHLSLDECAGATVPGFYGGAVELGNLERNSLDVYLSFIEQLWSRAQQQQAGTPAPELNL
ncbi:MAG: hypothetical protein CME34_05040 [Gordonia sp.]|uniref:hypothetical protein n=1 Tax=Gordonia sp. (in: high G+C Gram-positive bacteria) TaxID=84139 RepID=UPI000C63E6C6|nr:hypothetical protein [Gordonia sp. (in: high G+C Gram-positive bacteria)]MAU81231.1 hypothetical protein [Gordonia sp. (in: high G+C Gram-positive bacteria)]